jgi:hypothetical protein
MRCFPVPKMTVVVTQSVWIYECGRRISVFGQLGHFVSRRGLIASGRTRRHSNYA